MLTVSGITAVAEIVGQKFRDIDYRTKAKKREATVYQFRNQDYAAIKKFLQEGRFAFRDTQCPVLADDDVEWIPIEQPGQLERPTFFRDNIHSVAKYTFQPGRYANHKFISALSCVAQHPNLLRHIVPNRLEQNCSDRMEAPTAEDDGNDDAFTEEEYDSSDEHGVQIDERGQYSSYDHCGYGVDGEDVDNADDDEAQQPQYNEGPANYGIFDTSASDDGNIKSRPKLGIWDSDAYSSDDAAGDGANGYYNGYAGSTPSPTLEYFDEEKQVELVQKPQLPPIGNRYAGIFRFRLWSNGRWQEVCVDELLPYSSDGTFLSTRAIDENGRVVKDLWIPLLEKALSKLLGRYECLSDQRYGCVEDFLTDLTGGMCETLHLSHTEHQMDIGLQASLGQRMLQEIYCARGKKMIGGKMPGYYSVICASCVPDEHGTKKSGDLTENGLVYSRVYPVTDVREVSFAQVITSPFPNYKTCYLFETMHEVFDLVFLFIFFFFILTLLIILKVESMAPTEHTLLMVRLKDPFGTATWSGPFGEG